METIFPRASVPTMQDRFLRYNGTIPLRDGDASASGTTYNIVTKLRTLYNVRFFCYQFEDNTFPPDLPYIWSTNSSGEITIVVVIPGGHICNYLIEGNEEVIADAQHTETSVLGTAGAATVRIDLMHNHDGLTSPKVPASFLGVLGAPAGTFLKVNDAGTSIIFSTGTSVPGDFVTTAPVNLSTFNALAGGTVAFTWGASATATSYNIRIYDVTGGGRTLNYTADGVSSAMTRNKSTFTNGQTYQWSITAVNATGSTSSPVVAFSCALPI